MRLRRKKLPADDVPRKLLTLMLELLRTPEKLPPLAVGGLWRAVEQTVTGRPALGPPALEAGAFDLAVAQMVALGGATDQLVRRRALCSFVCLRG